MTGVETIARIRFEHFQNRKGIKRIARELGVARDTVRKVLRSQVTEFSYKRATQPLPKMGPWVGTLTAILEAEAKGSGHHGLNSPIRTYQYDFNPGPLGARR
jgi:predicted transcriptional regulator